MKLRSHASITLCLPVTNFILVLREVLSSNLMLYPTSSPTEQPLSDATRWAIVTAATRRGCVQTMQPDCPLLWNSSARYCTNWVLLPDPVSPTTMVVGNVFTDSTNWALRAAIGRSLELLMTGADLFIDRVDAHETGLRCVQGLLTYQPYLRSTSIISCIAIPYR